MATLIEKIENCGFECQAGQLQQCVDWDALKQKTDLWVIVGREQILKHTSGNGGWRFSVHTNKKEAESMAAALNRTSAYGEPLYTVKHLLDVT